MESMVQNVNIHICDSVDEAVSKGFTYSESEYTPVGIEKVVVVKDGMESGKCSLDFVLEDASGKKYVFMITQNLISSIASVAQAKSEQ